MGLRLPAASRLVPTVLLVAAHLVVVATPAHAAAGAADFNGDGYADLAVGVPQEDGSTATDIGGVHIIYGSSTGLTATNDKFITQNSSGIADTAEEGDQFGRAIAWGRFNGDVYSDLAVGVPYEDFSYDGSNRLDAGAVHILFGSASGLTATNSQFLTQKTFAIPDSPSRDDHFGWSLAAANLGRSSHGDLAIGIPNETRDDDFKTGAVTVIYGSDDGLNPVTSKLFAQGENGLPGGATSHESFGWSLAAGNMGKTSHADLAVGVPNDRSSAGTRNGRVNMIYGADGGLTTTGAQVSDFGLSEGSKLGFSVVIANFGKTSYKELAIGAPFGGQERGYVLLYYGATNGLTSTGKTFISSAEETLEEGDHFGSSLAAGNLSKTAEADLVVGIPDRDSPSAVRAGAINIYWGTSTGLTFTGDQMIYQFDVGQTTALDEKFGTSIYALNFGGSTYVDLAVGTPNENANGVFDAGMVTEIHGGASTGLFLDDARHWHQDTPGLESSAEPGDRFGQTLA